MLNALPSGADRKSLDEKEIENVCNKFSNQTDWRQVQME